LNQEKWFRKTVDKVVKNKARLCEIGERGQKQEKKKRRSKGVGVAVMKMSLFQLGKIPG
jgi:hypothetical protein